MDVGILLGPNERIPQVDTNWIRRMVARAGVSCWIISIVIFSSSVYKDPADLFSAFAFSAFFAFPAYVLVGFPWALDTKN